jgi:hypothetical protein
MTNIVILLNFKRKVTAKDSKEIFMLICFRLWTRETQQPVAER